MSRTISLFVISMLLATAWSSPTKEDREFQDFLQGLSVGYNLPVSHAYLAEKHFDHKDINITQLFSFLTQLSDYNPKDMGKTGEVVFGLHVLFGGFLDKRGKDLTDNENILTILQQTNFTLQDSVNFLYQVNKNKLESSLISVGETIKNNNKTLAGTLLGVILQKNLGTAFSLFLRGIADGVGTPVKMEYLVQNQFDNSSASGFFLTIELDLLVLTNVSHRRDRDVNLAIFGVNDFLNSARLRRTDQFEKNLGLTNIFVLVWAIYTFNGDVYNDVIKKHGFVNILHEVGASVPHDMERAGFQFGKLMKSISPYVPIQQEVEEKYITPGGRMHRKD